MSRFLKALCCIVLSLTFHEIRTQENSTRLNQANISITVKPKSVSINCSIAEENKAYNGILESGVANSSVKHSPENSTTEGEDLKDRIITSGEIHRYRIIVSGYLIIGVVLIGLLFLAVTHYLGRREVRKYQLKYGLPYRPVTRKDIQVV